MELLLPQKGNVTAMLVELENDVKLKRNMEENVTLIVFIVLELRPSIVYSAWITPHRTLVENVFVMRSLLVMTVVLIRTLEEIVIHDVLDALDPITLTV